MATETDGRVLDSNEVARQESIDQLKRGIRSFTQNKLSVVGLAMILTLVFAAVFAPYLAPYPDDAGPGVHFDRASEPPSLDHPMGTDTTGRDIFSRVLFGARLSLLMGLVVLTIAISIGVTLGLIAGYLGGSTNTVIMRTTDIFLAIPPTLLAMAVVAATGASLFNVMIAIAFSWWSWYTRLVQGEVLSIKEDEFIESSRALGSSWLRTTFKEILPNVVSPITVKATLDMGFVILVGAGLSFLGLGAQPPTPTWGAMIAQGRNYVTTFWWIAVFPGLAISFAVLGFNFIGDGLRDALDVEVN
ncbi:MAG: ABC transporter permease [Natronomonas sp.]|uniref:ABC transporter permease n=1 Tax=Natronomonas sp. TaxID=2184060 RepID=UPI0028704155|nr:ABC transporter permease [Natronomonas sp.]MDR9432108.1 ABC transporter permease [Natronomonas sp.]